MTAPEYPWRATPVEPMSPVDAQLRCLATEVALVRHRCIRLVEMGEEVPLADLDRYVDLSRRYAALSSLVIAVARESGISIADEPRKVIDEAHARVATEMRKAA